MLKMVRMLRVAPWANGARPISLKLDFLDLLGFALACNPGAIAFAQNWTIL